MPSVAIIGTRGYPSYYGGFETAVRKLAPYLADQGWDVTVYSRPGGARNDEQGRDRRVNVVETRGLERKSLSTLTYGLTSALHATTTKPDIALVMNVANGYWLPILKRAGIPALVNVDGIEWERAKWGRYAKRVFHRGAKWTAKYGTRMIYDSHEIARRWKEEFGLDGYYIPYGGDPVDEALPLESGLTHRGYVLIVARFVPENTVPEFFEAVPSLARHAHVVIVGSSGYGGLLDNQARDLAASSSRIHWLGHVNDDRRLHSLWQHCGVYFHGHSVGGTNPALVQAMALGAPIVALDTPYNREVLTDQGADFVASTSADIARVCIRLIADRARSDYISRIARQRATTSFSWAEVNARYNNALTSTMSEK